MGAAARTASLAGRTIVLTGASRGLGAAMARELARRGAHAVLLARDLDRLAAVAGAIGTDGGVATPIACDLTDHHAIETVAARILDEVGPVDVLVNNAGVGFDARTVDTTDDDVDGVFAVNVLGPMSLTRALGRSMISRRAGKIVNIASAAGLIGMGSLATYGASKAAIVHWTRCLAAEWARFGVTVNAVAPGFFVTEMNRHALSTDDARARALSAVPLRRFGDEEQLAEVVAFFASPASDYVTGQTLAVDGGMSSSR